MQIINDIERERMNKRVELAKQHASQSTTGNGVGSLLCGFALVAAYLINLFIDQRFIDGAFILIFICIWIVVKERLNRNCHRDFGKSHEKQPDGWLIYHKIMIGIFGLIDLYFWLDKPLIATIISGRLINLVIFTAYLPIAWKFCRTPYDFFSSILLILACMSSLAGQQSAFFDQFHVAYGLAGLIQLIIGVAQIWGNNLETPNRRHK